MLTKVLICSVSCEMIVLALFTCLFLKENLGLRLINCSESLQLLADSLALRLVSAMTAIPPVVCIDNKIKDTKRHYFSWKLTEILERAFNFVWVGFMFMISRTTQQWKSIRDFRQILYVVQERVNKIMKVQKCTAHRHWKSFTPSSCQNNHRFFLTVVIPIYEKSSCLVSWQKTEHSVYTASLTYRPFYETSRTGP